MLINYYHQTSLIDHNLDLLIYKTKLDTKVPRTLGIRNPILKINTTTVGVKYLKHIELTYACLKPYKGTGDYLCAHETDLVAGSSLPHSH